MAGFAGIAAVGRSIAMLLNSCFEEQPYVDGNTTTARLVGTSDFDSDAASTLVGSQALSIFLYRVDFNKVMRAAWSATSGQDGRSHLGLDLHYLITPWAKNAMP